MLERTGNVMTRVVPNVSTATLERHIFQNVRSAWRGSTDGWSAYRNLAKRGYRHGKVDHIAEQ